MLLSSLSAPPAVLQDPTALLVPEVAPAPAVPKLVPDLAAEHVPQAPTTALTSTRTSTLKAVAAHEPTLDDAPALVPGTELVPTLDDAPKAELTGWEKRREARKRARGVVRQEAL